MTSAPLTVLVTGATGYIGGRLVPRLLAGATPSARMTRDASRLRDVPWADAGRGGRGRRPRRRGAGRCARRRSPASTSPTTWSTRSAGRARFEDTDRRAAEAFAAAAQGAGVGADRLPRRAGPGARGAARRTWPPAPRSGRSCCDSGVPTAVLQAAVIIGSGSASFEMLRYLTERLPAMITPKWVRQPDPADRRARRPALPGRRRRRCRRRVAALRHRRSGGPHLPAR